MKFKTYLKFKKERGNATKKISLKTRCNFLVEVVMYECAIGLFFSKMCEDWGIDGIAGMQALFSSSKGFHRRVNNQLFLRVRVENVKVINVVAGYA